MNGGVRSYEFAKRLVADGHRVQLVTADCENKFKGWKVEEIEGIEVHWVSISYNNSFGFTKRLWAFFKFLILASFRICSLKSDKLIATSTPLTVAVPALIYKFVTRKQYIFEVRDVWPEVPIALGVVKNPILKKAAYFLEKTAYRNASSIICLSPDMKASIESRTKNKAVYVIPNASDRYLFENKEENIELIEKLSQISGKHKRIVFYTGTLGLVNNLAYLISLSSFSDGKLGFVVIGDGKEKPELIELARKQNVLNKTFYILEAVKKSELSTVHSIFDLACSTVLPIKELNANSANKVFDAFASGTPLMINHQGWIKDLITKNRCGIALGSAGTEQDYRKLEEFVLDKERMFTASVESKRLGTVSFDREVLYQKFKEVVVGKGCEKVI